MPGPPPKHGGRRSSSSSKALELAPAPTATPDPPAGLLKKTRDQWVAFWSSDVAGVVASATDMPALERLFTLYDERERYSRAVKKSPLVTGSKGQMVLNPLSRQVGALDPEIRQLEDRFGLTPMARLKLGIKLGAARRTLDDLNDSLAEVDENEDDPRLEIVESDGAT